MWGVPDASSCKLEYVSDLDFIVIDQAICSVENMYFEYSINHRSVFMDVNRCLFYIPSSSTHICHLHCIMCGDVY